MTCDALPRISAFYYLPPTLVFTGEADYLTQIAAAQRLAAALQPEARAAAGEITARAARLPAPPAFVAWLRRQPQNGAVVLALSAATRGPTALTDHLLRKAGAKGLAALLHLQSEKSHSGAEGEQFLNTLTSLATILCFLSFLALFGEFHSGCMRWTHQ